MKIRSIYISIIACGMLASCNKFLDVKPIGKLIPTTVTDYDNLLNNLTNLESNFVDNSKGSMLTFLTDNVTMSEGQAKVGFILNNHPNISRYYAYIYRQPYKDPQVNDYFWGNQTSGLYPQINYFNNVIDGIPGVPNKSAADELLGKASIAQALVARAWCYFNMNLVYGPVYKPGTPNTARTIPYVTSPNLSDPIPMLSTADEVMSKVFNDLQSALPDLPENAWPTRANKSVAYAMLANYYLFTHKYDSVVYYANLSWTSGTGGNAAKVLYDYNQFTLASPAPNEWTAAIRTPQDNFIFNTNHREILFYRGTDNTVGTAALLSYPSTELINLFDQQNDLRFKFYYIPSPGYSTASGGGYNDGTQISNYRFSKTRMTDGFTYPEVLLMRAEGYARTNQLNLAIADLNTLRRYRYKTGTPELTAGTQDQVIQQVLDERRREVGGGLKRFLDLKRLVNDTGKPWCKTQVSHTLGTQTYNATVDSPDFIITISNSVLLFNSHWGIPLDTRPFQ